MAAIKRCPYENSSRSQTTAVHPYLLKKIVAARLNKCITRIHGQMQCVPKNHHFLKFYFAHIADVLR